MCVIDGGCVSEQKGLNDTAYNFLKAEKGCETCEVKGLKMF
jgi:hypothetical protein